VSIVVGFSTLVGTYTFHVKSEFKFPSNQSLCYQMSPAYTFEIFMATSLTPFTITQEFEFDWNKQQDYALNASPIESWLPADAVI
jgi:hypothetical protein